MADLLKHYLMAHQTVCVCVCQFTRYSIHCVCVCIVVRAFCHFARMPLLHILPGYAAYVLYVRFFYDMKALFITESVCVSTRIHTVSLCRWPLSVVWSEMMIDKNGQNVKRKLMGNTPRFQVNLCVCFV